MDLAGVMHLALSLDALGNSALVAFGIGLVIFVHELGHFLAARRAGVRVEVFSLGFGPRVLGFVRGGTDYRLSLVPVGGYVKVAGDAPGEGSGAPDELSSKGVAARALFYSGGVLMNVAFGLIAFPIVFWLGVPMLEPRLGGVTPGGPAWQAGLREGDLVQSVNGHRVLNFEDVVLELALGDPKRTRLTIERGGETLAVDVKPEYAEAAGHYSIQAAQPTDYRVRVLPGGPAERAGLRSGDRIVAIAGEPVSYESSQTLFDALDAKPLTLDVEREAGGRPERVTIAPETHDGERYYLGILAQSNAVVGTRGPFAAGPFREGDRIVAVDGHAIAAAEDLAAAPVDPAGADVEYVRDGRRESVRLEPPLAARLGQDVALGAKLDAIPGGIPVRVAAGSAAERGGLLGGDRLLEVNGRAVERWADVLAAMADNEGEPVAVRAARGGEEVVLEIVPVRAQVPDFGFELERSYVTRSFAPGEAFVAGARSAWNLARQFYLTLRKMVAREVSTEKNLGGIVAISAVSYHYAQRGATTLFYFLALLSVHLAFINVLPIPLFDGSHLLFLLIEKVKGSPVNERVLGYTQVLGMVLVLSLLIYVTYNDIQRLLS